MEKELARLGSSPMAMVPCVKELLIKDTLTTVPPRFVRSDLDPPFVSSDATTPQIPVVDFHKLTSPEFMDTELHKFHHACRDWGFFQLINHGVEDSVVEKVKLEVIEFFNLPMEEKKKLWQKPGEVEGFGQAFVRSEEQKLDWVDIFFMIILPTHLRNPNLFPKVPLQLREALEAYSTGLNKLGMEIISSIEKALGMELNELNDIFEEFQLGMRMNYYPPCPQPDMAIGFAPHSDGVGFTILLQVNEIEGLQVKKDGMWVPVKPLPNAFLINIGAVLEIITNETYRSIEHRATVNSEKERFSIATFFNPTREKEIGPASSLVTPENPALFGRITVGDFYKGYFSRELRDKKFLEFLKNDRDGQSN